MNQIIPQDMTICLRSAFPSVPPDCIEALMSAAYSVRNAQYHVYSFRHRLASAMTAIICGASSLHAEFAFGAGTKDVDTQLHTIMRNFKTSGAAVVVAKDGEIVYEYYYGYADKKSKKPITDSTYFRLASVTKLVTAIRTMQLVEQGALDLDRDISAYLGYDIRNPYHRKTPIMLRMLMTHTSSLSPDAANYHPDWNRIGKKGYDPIFNESIEPGTQYAYADYNGGLFGSLIEAISGQSVQNYMNQKVFAPLGLTAAYSPRFLPAGTAARDLLNPNGKIQISVQKDRNRAYNNKADPKANNGYTVGKLYINAESLTKLAQMMYYGGTLNGVRILKAKTVKLMEADQKGLADSKYGLSTVRLNQFAGGTWYGHQGRYSGLSSNVYYQRETGITMALIMNGYDYKLEDNVVMPAVTLLKNMKKIEDLCFGKTK